MRGFVIWGKGVNFMGTSFCKLLSKIPFYSVKEDTDSLKLNHYDSNCKLKCDV